MAEEPTKSESIRKSAEALVSGYHAMTDVLKENERLEIENKAARDEVENWRTETLIVRQENDNLKKEINRTKAQRDHYFKAFTALKAQLTSLGFGFLEAVKSSEVHDYGERGGMPDRNSTPPMPRVVREGPRMDDARRSANGR